MGEEVNLLEIKPEDLGEPQADVVEAVEAMSKTQSPDEILKDAAKLLVESETRHAEEMQKAIDALVAFNKSNTENATVIVDMSKKSVETLERAQKVLDSSAKEINGLYGPLDEDLTELEAKVENLIITACVLGAFTLVAILIAIFK